MPLVQTSGSPFLYILKTSNRSAWFCLSFKDYKRRNCNLSVYSNGNMLVKRCFTWPLHWCLCWTVVIRKKRWSSRRKRRLTEKRRNVWRECREKSRRGWRGRRFVLVSLWMWVLALTQCALECQWTATEIITGPPAPRGAGVPLSSLYLSFVLFASSFFALFTSFPFIFSSTLPIFSFIHHFLFYQNHPTPFPGRRL